MFSTPTKSGEKKSVTTHPTSSWMAREYREGVGGQGLGVRRKKRPSPLLLNFDLRFWISRLHFFIPHPSSLIPSLALASLLFVGCSHSTSPNGRAIAEE